MNINTNTGLTSQTGNTTASQETGQKDRADTETGGNAAVTNSDSVSLSDTALLISNVVNMPASYPEPDSQRIADLKQEIIGGTYTIDSRRIAERFHQFNVNF